MGRGRIAASFVVAVLAALTLAPAAGASGCDPLDPSACLLPWPNDHFTRSDPGTPTGRRLDLVDAQMPRNAQGVPIAAADYDAADGFSPGAALVTRFPGLDSDAALARTGAVPETDLARYRDERAPIVVIDAQTGRRQPIWAEVDHAATSDATRDLLIHPAVNFSERHRYIVALRRLRGADGHALAPSAAFRRYRDGIRTGDRAFEARRPHMESLFRSLAPRGDRRRLARPRLGLHRRQRAHAGLADAGHPRRRLRHAGRPAAGRPAGAGAPAGLPRRAGAGLHTGPERRTSAAGWTAPWTSPATSTSRAARPARASCSTPAGARTRTPGNVQQARFICDIPRSATTPRTRGASRSTGTGSSAPRRRSTASPAAIWPARTASCSARPTGRACRPCDLPNTFGVLHDLSRLPDAGRPPPAGLPGLPVPGARARPPGRLRGEPGVPGRRGAADRHAAPVLRRRQPGRHPRRRRERGGARLDPRGAHRPRDDLQHAADPQRGLRRVLGAAVPVVPERARAAADPVAHPEPVGPRRPRRLRPAPHARPLPRHAAPRRPAPHGLRRPPGRERHDAGRGAGRSGRACGRRRSTPAAAPTCSPSGGSRGCGPASRPAAARSSSGTSARCGRRAAAPPARRRAWGRRRRRSATRRRGWAVDPHGITGRDPLAQQQFSAFLALGGRFVDVCGTKPCYAGGWTGPTP